MSARIVAVCLSQNTGEQKQEVVMAEFKVDHGIVGDAHAGNWHRQVSLLASESIRKMRDLGLDVDNGAFAENLTTEGLALTKLPIGALLRIGDVVLEITQIGKECHSPCAIYHQAGDCVMPREGVFAKVLQGGFVRPGDALEALASRRGNPQP